MQRELCFQSYIKCVRNDQPVIYKSNEVFVKVIEKRESIELIPHHPDQCYNVVENKGSCYSCARFLCLLILGCCRH